MIDVQTGIVTCAVIELRTSFIDGMTRTFDGTLSISKRLVELLRDFRPGDVDLDGVIGFSDFLTMSANFGKVAIGGWIDGDMISTASLAFQISW